MRSCLVTSVLLLAASAQAQNLGSTPGGGTSGAYTFEMRLIADGDAGAPAGPGTTYNIGNVGNITATRIGFWLQARVAQTANQNWGVVRASSPAGGTSASFIAVTDAVAGGSVLTRGSTNAANTNFGRGFGYRSGGASTGQTGNVSGNAPFPHSPGNENGGLDNSGAGAVTRRVYAFDCYVGSSRLPADPDNPTNPWNVNGASGAGSAVPSNGTFSPWANLYRVWLDITNTTQREIIVTATALLNGAVQTAPIDASQQSWAMQVAVENGVVATASYRLGMPTPGAATVLGLGGLAAMRRRRRGDR
jgi:MYXO-CTERM domain-containing protein